jgi:hypothetical protein
VSYNIDRATSPHGSFSASSSSGGGGGSVRYHRLQHVLQGVEGGSIEEGRIRLGVAMAGLDHPHNLLLLDVNRTVLIESCGQSSHYAGGATNMHNYSDANRLQPLPPRSHMRGVSNDIPVEEVDELGFAPSVYAPEQPVFGYRDEQGVCSVVEVMETLYYGKTLARGNSSGRGGTPRWAAVLTVVRSNGDNNPAAPSEGVGFSGVGFSTFLRVVKDIAAVPLYDKLYECRDGGGYEGYNSTSEEHRLGDGCGRITEVGEGGVGEGGGRGGVEVLEWMLGESEFRCPFTNQRGSPCFDGGNPCLGAGCDEGGGCGEDLAKAEEDGLPAAVGRAGGTRASSAAVFERCRARVEGYCTHTSTNTSTNTSGDAACATGPTPQFSPPGRECEYNATQEGSPCATGENPCFHSSASERRNASEHRLQLLGVSPELGSETCVDHMRSYCDSIEGSTDPGCAHTTLPVGYSGTSVCPFANVPGSPCYTGDESADTHACIGDAKASSQACHAQIRAHCFGTSTASDGTAGTIDVAASARVAVVEGCSNWEWWSQPSAGGACPFTNSTPGSPCSLLRNATSSSTTSSGGGGGVSACLRSHCVLRLSLVKGQPWASCASLFLPERHDPLTIHATDDGPRECHREISEYCMSAGVAGGGVGSEDPACALVNSGCGSMELELPASLSAGGVASSFVCPFRAEVGSPCCNGGANPCVPNVTVPSVSVSQCAAFVTSYCEQPENMPTVDSSGGLVFPSTADPGCTSALNATTSHFIMSHR